MAQKTRETCGGLVVEMGGREPPLTGFGCVQCCSCYDGKTERIEPPPQRYGPGARCKTCGVKLPTGRRGGRCARCQQYRRREVRKEYMREYMRARRQPQENLVAC